MITKKQVDDIEILMELILGTTENEVSFVDNGIKSRLNCKI